MKFPAVFFDRDGVLNKSLIKHGKPHPPADLSELEIADDALDALTRLKQAGFLLIGVTNQPDVARGTTDRATVDAINHAIMECLPMAEIRVCYHDDVDQCRCRKPKPGMLIQAAEDYDIDLAKSYMVGDRWKDIDAGKAANCKTIWLQTEYDEKQPSNMDYSAATLTEVANIICQQALES